MSVCVCVCVCVHVYMIHEAICKMTRLCSLSCSHCTSLSNILFIACVQFMYTSVSLQTSHDNTVYLEP